MISIKNLSLYDHLQLFEIPKTLIFEAWNFSCDLETLWIVKRNAINHIDQLFSMP